MDSTTSSYMTKLSGNNSSKSTNHQWLGLIVLVALTILNGLMLFNHIQIEAPPSTNENSQSSTISFQNHNTRRNLFGNRYLSENNQQHHHNNSHSKCHSFSDGDPQPRIIVTGGAGFFGSHLVSKLKSPPYNYASVKIVDNLHSTGGSTANLLDPSTGHPIIDIDRDLCIADLQHLHGSEAAAIFSKVDWVFHLASSVPRNGPQPANPAQHFYKSNLQVHTNTISLATHFNASIFIFISSMMGYDLDWDRRLNLQDPSALEVNQVHLPLSSSDALTSYHLSKYLGEYELSLLPHESSLKTASLRFHHLYGPRYFPSSARPLTNEALQAINRQQYDFLNLPTWDVLLTLLEHAQSGNMDFEVLGEPSQYVDLLYVDDAVEAVMRTVGALNKSQASFKEPLQIGSGVTTTLDDVVYVLTHLLESCLGLKLNPVYFEKSLNYRTTGKVALTARATKQLDGWTANVSLSEGFGRVLSYLQHEKFDASAVGSLLKERSQCLLSAWSNSSSMPPPVRSATTPILAKPQDVRLYAPPGSIYDSMQKVFCEADRKKVLDSVDWSLVPNRTLIVVLSSTRSHHITWNNFDRHLLKALDADLALSILTEQQGEKVNSFRANAKYIWEINPPKDNDYMHFYNEIAMECFNHPFNARYAEVIHSVNYKWSGWLGCIKASKHRACAALIWFFRWFAQQQILNAKLYLKYSRIVITRSDFLWVANHAPANIVVKRNTLYVPEASDWGGLSDRHYMLTTYDAIRSLHLLEAAIADKDPEKQKQWLKDNEFNYGKGNSEWANLAWHQDVLHMQVERFRHTGMLVIDPEDSAVNTGFGQRIPEKVSTIYLIKYPDEFEYLKKHNFEGHVKALPDGLLVKGSTKSCYLIEDGKRRPFNGLQSFVGRGFDFDQVQIIEDEDLYAIPMGETLY